MSQNQKLTIIAYRNLKVCAVGFEPNKHLAPALKDLEESYNKCGWRTIIHTLTGVDAKAGKAQVSKINPKKLSLI